MTKKKFIKNVLNVRPTLGERIHYQQQNTGKRKKLREPNYLPTH